MEAVMGGWLRRFVKGFLEGWYFDKSESGATVYVPRGSLNFFGRTAYLVPDEATEKRITRIHRLATLATLGSSAVAVLVILAGIQLVPYALHRWLFLGVAAALVLETVAASVIAERRAAVGLSRAPDRSLRQVLVAQNENLGSKRNVWVYTALLTLLCGAALVGLHFDYQEQPRTTTVVLACLIAAIYIPLIALGPYYLRMRRLKEEHERLETVVQERTAELAELNRTLEARVEEQVRDIERLGQLRHFFAAPVADLILGGNASDLSKVHRRELSVVSIDLRGFTAFSETAEPEEVISVLRVYHAELGILVNRYQATLEHFAGDGAMIFLNDPIDIPDHPQRAVRLATELRAAMRPHLEEWRRLGFDLGMGAGIAVGYATIGAIGYEGRWEYAAIGNVCNLANRLCSEARDGQVITTHRVGSRIDPATALVPLGELALKGFTRPIAAFNVAAS
jgi:class 3 adenylate cyclase/membrane protein YdbS with pleckstrin-like domain